MNLILRNASAFLIGILVIAPFGVVGMPTATAFAAAACDPATELVTNGSFETPVVTSVPLWDIFSPSLAGIGWNATWLPSDAATYNGETQPVNAFLEFQRNGHDAWGFPYDGQQYAELDTDWKGPNFPSQSYPASIDMFQDIATIPGNTYTLTFATSPRPDDGDLSDNIAKVSWNGGIIDTIAPTSVNPASTTWTTHTYTLTATASTTRIDFVDGGHPNAIGIFVDAVSLKCASGAVNGGGGNGGGGNGGGGNGGGGGGPIIINPATSTPATSTLTVIVLVVNANGGTSTPANFTVNASGNGISSTIATSSATSTTFLGSASGTVFTLGAGPFSVTVANPGNYTTTLGAGCNGSIVAGINAVCTITNTDPVPAPAGGGNGGGGGSGPIIIQGGGGIPSGGGGGSSGGSSGTSSGGGSAATSTNATSSNTGVGGGGGVIPPAGQVLGDSTTTVPGMPYTGNGDAMNNLIELLSTFVIGVSAFAFLKMRLA
jgi:hypothetical protein